MTDQERDAIFILRGVAILALSHDIVALPERVRQAIAIAGALAGAPDLPRLPSWCFQPDAEAPGLYLQCETSEQRAAIMRALGGAT